MKNKKILVTGGAGFLGSHVVKKLLERGVSRKNITVIRSKDCDLRVWENCKKAVAGQNIVIHLAANSGSIAYNIKNPGELFFNNITMNTHIIEAARQAGVEKLQTVSAICSYPKFAPVPFHETDYWNGHVEETNAAYGLAKKMLTVQTLAYRQQYDFNGSCVIVANLYGPGDDFNPERSHVIPAMIKKVADAKAGGKKYIEMWGTGIARRDFFYVEDAAEGIILATEKYHKPDLVNVGSGKEISVKRLIQLICKIMDFKDEIRWDSTKPDGQLRRNMDVSIAKKEFGFKATTDFETGLRATVDWFKKNPLKAVRTDSKSILA